ncbi:hypothetical protein ABVK25_008250 [Lepraria finkii]|uniref:SAP domain-containing protein n=1 Tax=Lepraria finkii TaxID=1340010 RepID=A0ABR4B2F4_9LECA
MASNFLWLSTCKSSQLKALATAVGINSSGTKPILTSQLLEHLPRGYFSHVKNTGISKGPYNIVSIDMGIRNLAYCRLVKPQTKTAAKSANETPIEAPKITEWTRMEISKKTVKSKDLEEPKAAVKEAFDPATYSLYAYNLVTSLLKSSPTHILIDPQRFRSLGGSAVQDWTLRVNMFEAMIYAVLKSFSESGQWKGSVHPVMPAKVAKFWLGDKQGVEEEEGRVSKSEKTKGAKIAVVGRWLEEGDGGEGFWGWRDRRGRWGRDICGRGGVGRG